MAGALAIHRPGHHLRHVSKHHEGGRAVPRLGGAYRAPANSEEARSRTYDPRRLALVKDHAVPIRPTRPTVTEISPIVRRRTSVTVPAGHHQAADFPNSTASLPVTEHRHGDIPRPVGGRSWLGWNQERFRK
jgi:hypothetical protein